MESAFLVSWVFLGVFKSENLLLVKSLGIGEAWDRREMYL